MRCAILNNIIMNSATESILSRFPQLTFQPTTTGSCWDGERRIVYIDQTDSTAIVLHEISHALLRHRHYRRDIELLQLEASAWQQTMLLARDLDLLVPKLEETATTALDSYRDWLYARSQCPRCQHTGVQSTVDTYRCLVCLAHWRVNEARVCGLKRVRIS